MKYLLIICGIVFYSCAEKRGEEYDAARTERYIKYNNQKFEQEWLKNARNARNFFTPDACISYPPVKICDTASIILFMQQMADSGFVKQEILTLSFEGNNDSLVEQGRYVLRDSSGAMAEKGSYSTTWKRHQGYFKYHRVIMQKDGL